MKGIPFNQMKYRFSSQLLKRGSKRAKCSKYSRDKVKLSNYHTVSRTTDFFMNWNYPKLLEPFRKKSQSAEKIKGSKKMVFSLVSLFLAKTRKKNVQSGIRTRAYANMLYSTHPIWYWSNFKQIITSRERPK